MFYGKGAGKLPTASAVVADVVDAVKHQGTNIMTIWEQDKVELGMPVLRPRGRHNIQGDDREGLR